MMPKNSLSLDEIEAEIAQIEKDIAVPRARLAELKRARRAKVAAKASAAARAAKVPPAAVRASRNEIDGERGHIPILADQFKRSSRTIHRKLGKRR